MSTICTLNAYPTQNWHVQKVVCKAQDQYADKLGKTAIISHIVMVEAVVNLWMLLTSIIDTYEVF